MMDTYVYIIEQVGSTFCKVGVSNEPVRRLAELQRHNPNRMAISYVLEPQISVNAYSLENNIHYLLSDYRLEGEWFKLPAKGAFSLIYANHRIVKLIGCVIEYPDWVIEPRKKRQWPHVSIPTPSYETRATALFLFCTVACFLVIFSAWAGVIAPTFVQLLSLWILGLISFAGLMTSSGGHDVEFSGHQRQERDR